MAVSLAFTPAASATSKTCEVPEGLVLLVAVLGRLVLLLFLVLLFWGIFEPRMGLLGFIFHFSLGFWKAKPSFGASVFQ